MADPRRALPVAFTGAPGAYSQDAARRFFGDASSTLTCKNAAEAIEAVNTGRAGYAVLPIENTITGCFPGVAEALFDTEIGVIGEVVLSIRHCLLAAPGAALEDLSVVTSHPSALSQCRDWLANWGVATRPSSDSAEAARELARTNDAALGVIGSRSLAQKYDLDVLAEGLSDRSDNKNRFFVLAGAPTPAGDEPGLRTAVLVGPLSTPRVLKTLRIQLESLGARRARAPYLGSEDGTRYLVEFDHDEGAGEEITRRACGALPHRLLGSWRPALVAGNGSGRRRIPHP